MAQPNDNNNKASLSEVTIELIHANLTLNKINDNTNLTNEFMNLSIDTMKQGFGDMLSFFKGNSLANLEREREQAEFNKDMLDALRDLKPKYAGPDKAAEPKDADFGLGGLLTGLAVVVGSIVGVIRAQLQAIKLFAKALMPVEWIDKIRKVFTSFVAGLSMSFDLLKASVMEKLASVGKFLASTFDDVIKFFSGESKLFSGIKSAFTTLFQPFKELFSIVKGLMSGPFAAVGEMFSGIATSLSKFGALVGKVAGIVGKFFLPLTIVMTVWDTVKGMIEGFKKDGIIGAIGGAVKGFFNSLIFGPIDMIKDATAWVLGFFGFDKAKEFLNSFSFEKTFSTIIDAITSPIETLKNLMSGVVKFFTDIGGKISGFFTGFEIPGFSIMGMKFGPWKPFASSSSKEEATTNTQTTSNVSSTATSTDKKNLNSSTDKKSLSSSTATSNVSSTATSTDKKNLNSSSSTSTSTDKSTTSALAPSNAGPNWKAIVADYKLSTPVDHLEKQYPGISDKFRALASNSKPKTDTLQSINTHEQMLLSKALSESQSVTTNSSTKNTASQLSSTQTATAPTTGGTAGVGAVPSVSSSKVPSAVTKANALRAEAIKLGIDPNKAQGTFEGGVLTGITDTTTGETYSIAIDPANQQNVDAARRMRSMNENSGKLAAASQQGMAVQSGDQLQTAAQEKGMLQAMPSGGGSAGGGGGVQQNNSTTVVNNSTVVVKPIPSASRRPNNSEDIFFGRTAGYAF